MAARYLAGAPETSTAARHRQGEWCTIRGAVKPAFDRLASAARTGLLMGTYMKALVKRESRKGIWMEDVPIPATGTNRTRDNSQSRRRTA